jgi:N-methylhydantoinase A
VPGPACYMRGGAQPTVTDAHVALGHLPTRLLGGRMALDADAATTAIRDGVATPLGLSLHDAARGVLAIADSNMVGAIRLISVERGHDPRDFTLVPFGGAGPLHGCALAAMLGITRVLIPAAPGVLCAEGLLAADLKAEFSRTLRAVGEADVASVFAELEREAVEWFAQEQVAPADRATSRVAMLRYHGQGGELTVPWAGDIARTEAAFAAAHQALYGFTLEAAVELVTVRVEAVGRLAEPPRPAVPERPPVEATEFWTVHFAGGAREVPILDRAALGAGARFPGPVIVTQLDATTIVPPGWDCAVHPSGALLLTAQS